VQRQSNARKQKQKLRRAKQKLSASKLSKLIMIVNNVFSVPGPASFEQQDSAKPRRFEREFGRMNLMPLEAK
jgi:hypothetical protein